MSIQFTTDGYVEPMDLRVGLIVMGAAVIVLSGALGWFVHVCVALPLTLIGALTMVNAKGQRRYRVTRTKLLIEDEPLVWASLIGPIRNRIPWEDVVEVERVDDAVRMVHKGGELLLGQGGSAHDLDRFMGRINLALED